MATFAHCIRLLGLTLVASATLGCSSSGLGVDGSSSHGDGPASDRVGVDAAPDGHTDGPSCSDAGFFYCVQGGGGLGQGVACSDAASPAVCDQGEWTCGRFGIPTSACNCFGASPPGCVCSLHGWSCD